MPQDTPPQETPISAVQFADFTSANIPIDQALAHYAAGFFPMPASSYARLLLQDQEPLDRNGAHAPISWCRTLPPAGAPVRALRVPRRLRKTVRRRPYRISVDTTFMSVLEACADPGRPGHWITEEIAELARRLHDAGHAHSIEVWDGDTLVGGLVGTAVGKVFFGESMFTHADDAGKIAFVHLAARLHHGGYALLDTQMASDHMARFGPRAIDNSIVDAYYDALTTAADMPANFGPAGDDDPDAVAAFLTACTRYPENTPDSRPAQV